MELSVPAYTDRELARLLILGGLLNGIYRFRFRRVCNAPSGIISDWTTAYLDVNV